MLPKWLRTVPKLRFKNSDAVKKIESESERLRRMNVEKGMKENYGTYLKWGGMYLKDGNSWIVAVNVLLAAMHFPSMFTAVYLALDDLVVFAETLHFIMVLMLGLVVSFNCMSERRKLDNIYEAMGKNYYDYEDSLDRKSKKKISQSRAESTRRLNVIHKCFTVGVVCAVTAAGIGRPILQYYLQHMLITKKLPDGVNGAKVTFMYYPWDRDNTWLNVVGYILQDAYTLLTANQVMGYSMMFFGVAESIVFQLEKLAVSLSRIKFRAAHLAKLDPKDFKLEDIDKFHRAIHLCFKHSIKHHQEIVRIFKDFKAASRFILMLLLTGLTFLLCLSSVLFTSDASIISKGVFATMIFIELLLAYLQCSYSELFADLSSDMPWYIYKSDWYSISKDVLVEHRLLTIRCAQPLRLSAGGFADVSKNTFLEVIKTAFSYANLLQASKNITDEK